MRTTDLKSLKKILITLFWELEMNTTIVKHVSYKLDLS